MTPGAAGAVPPSAPVAPASTAAGYAAAQQAAYGVPPANWAGYVHPSAFAAAPLVPPANAPAGPTAAETMAAGVRDQAIRDANAAAYATPYGAENPYTAPPVAPIPTTASRFPIGALWLIGLGVLVLVHTLTPDWGFSSEWIVAAVLAGTAVWIFMRRLSYMGGATALHEGNAPRLVCTLRGPVLLLTLAVMFALQAADVVRLGRTWPILLIVSARSS